MSMQWTGGKIPPDAVPNDWKVGHRQEGSMGTTSPRTSAGLQQYLICSHRVLTPLPHVWEVTSPPCRLFLPHDWCKYKSPSCPHYVEEVQKHFKEAYAEAQHQSNSEVDRQKCNYDKSMSTVQLMPGDVVLKKADAFQGKRKVKDHRSEVEYEVICQVTNGVPSYEIKGLSGNVKVIHHN